MEARSKNLGFGFPGYDRCFPKATRSSRGRGDGIKRNGDASDFPKDLQFFELLATVAAGQLLQEQNDQASIGKGRETPEYAGETDMTKEIEFVETNGTPIRQRAAVQKGSRNAGTGSIAEAKKGRLDPGSHNRNVISKHDVHHECLAISCLGDSDLLMPKDFEPKTTMTYSSRKRKNSETSSCSQKDSADTVLFSPQMKQQSGHQELEAVTGKPNHFSAITHAENAASMHPYGSGDTSSGIEKLNVVHGEDQQLPTANGPCEDIELIIRTSFHVVDAESPPLVSSGSSEENPCLLEPKSDSTTAVESKRQDLGFFCSKTGYEDGNSSESTIVKSLTTKSSNSSYKSLKGRRPAHSMTKKQESPAATKRKRHKMEEGEKDGKDGKLRSPNARGGRNGGNLTAPLQNNMKPSRFPSLDIVEDTAMDVQPLVSPQHKLEKDSEKATGIPSPSKSTAMKSGDHFKFSIESFMVPELSVDLPESATVANLKKAVMDAAMNLLGGGLSVRVLLQGKKVADESESLLQAGISNGGKLGFMLEPSPVLPKPTGVEDAFLVLSPGSNQASVRYSVPLKGSDVNAGSLHKGLNMDESKPDMQSTTVSPSKQQDNLIQETNAMVVPRSCALIVHPSQVNNGPDGLAVVPFGQNAANKRRTRRPFSVAEVEVLVQAVEKLGTGRWRDVKLHAFSQAKHRTYVDLKDKWKTLVHTASIAPHQRRGEPVPQVLLDRVIQAHSYWTAQQAKQQSVETKVF